MKRITKVDGKKMQLPATKGDVAMAAIQIRGILIHLRSIALALAEGDPEKIKERIKGFDEHDGSLMEWLQVLVGAEDG